MKSRLFWKILPGFLIAVILILYSVWTAIVLTSDDYLSSERESARILAIYQLSAAQLAIESGGIAKFKELSQGWEAQDSDPRSGRNYWNRLSVVETKRVIDSEEATNGRRDFVVVYAIDPESKKWAVRYKLPPDTPPESWSITDAFPSILTIEWVIPGLLGGLLFSAILVWYVNRPIQRLRNGFRKLAEGQLSTRLGPAMGRRRDEIADLANDFDRMAERLQQLVLARDQLLHDVSHELRSPLARLNLAVVLAGQDAAAPRAPLQRIESEVERLDGLVGELLSLSRGESDESERDDYFDMRALVDAVVDDATFEAQYRGVSMVARIEPEQHTLMQGSAKLVRRAIENIIRNAIQFSAQGDAVEVSLSVDGELNQVMLLIADRGPGVPEADLLRMQEPFVRLQNGLDRQGYGLGLAIARRAVQCHKGALVAANRAGGGLVVTVTLPLMNMVLHVADCIVEKEE